MVGLVGKLMGEQYPEVRENAGQCKAVIRGEEENFLVVYRQGMARLDEFLAGAAQSHARGAVLAGSGEFAFQLHDTYGFPIDITQKVIEERGFGLDEGGFRAAMQAQRERARASAVTSDAVFTASVAVKLRSAGQAPTTFVGYDALASDSEVAALVGDGDVLLDRAEVGQRVLVVAGATPFYAQGGGQVGDRGRIESATGTAVVTTTTALDGFWLHRAEVQSGWLERGQAARFAVDEVARRATERNHTATHLLHAALKQVLGGHVSQAGSEVAPDRLRFDYTQPEKPSEQQLQAVEDLVNDQVLRATEVAACEQALDHARQNGFVALFGEKYGDRVRTLQVGEFSKELCGGTHVGNTGNIGAFRVVSEAAIAAGTRRIEAVTGDTALALWRSERQQLGAVTALLKVSGDKLPDRVQELQQELKRLRKELEQALAPDLDVELPKLAAQIVGHDGVHTVVYERAGLLPKDAAELLRLAQQQHEPFAGVVLSPGDDGVHVIAAVSKSLTGRVRAGDLVKQIAAVLGGGGGGRPEAAQGKGRDPSRGKEAVSKATELLRAAGLRP
jgi:alanyl-tRNA synthetase